jgi:hypothetical protein
MDGADRRRTLHRSPENRKVDGSTPSLATTSDQRKRLLASIIILLWSHLSNCLSKQLVDLVDNLPLKVGREVLVASWSWCCWTNP